MSPSSARRPATGSCGFARWTRRTSGRCPERRGPSEGTSGRRTARRSRSPREGELRKIALASGTVQRLCKLPQELRRRHVERRGDDRVRRRRTQRGLYSVPEAGRGGEAPRLARRSAEGDVPRLAAVPARRAPPPARGTGRGRRPGRPLRHLSRVPRGETTRSGPGAVRAQLVPGHLLFVQDGILMAQRFDARGLVTMGDAVPIAASVAAFAAVPGFGWFSASNTGRVAWLSGQNSHRLAPRVGRPRRSNPRVARRARAGMVSSPCPRTADASRWRSRTPRAGTTSG